MLKANMAPIIVTHTFPASIDAVWKALTDIGQMRQWYFDNIPDFKPEVGFETQFDVKSENRHFLHKWQVTEVVPMKRIAYNWTFDNYPGASTSIFDLSSQGASTTLTLTVVVTESFPEGIPEFQRDSCVAGWEYFIGQRLRSYLALAQPEAS
jgi:uncharacterized protein YndB with AHSA1/START domain